MRGIGDIPLIKPEKEEVDMAVSYPFFPSHP